MPNREQYRCTGFSSAREIIHGQCPNKSGNPHPMECGRCVFLESPVSLPKTADVFSAPALINTGTVEDGSDIALSPTAHGVDHQEKVQKIRETAKHHPELSRVAWATEQSLTSKRIWARDPSTLLTNGD